MSPLYSMPFILVLLFLRMFNSTVLCLSFRFSFSSECSTLCSMPFIPVLLFFRMFNSMFYAFYSGSPFLQNVQLYVLCLLFRFSFSSECSTLCSRPFIPVLLFFRMFNSMFYAFHSGSPFLQNVQLYVLGLSFRFSFSSECSTLCSMPFIPVLLFFRMFNFLSMYCTNEVFALSFYVFSLSPLNNDFLRVVVFPSCLIACLNRHK